MDAAQLLRAAGGPATSPSGAAGLAGLISIVTAGSAASFGLDAASRVLIVVTEAALL